MAGGVKCGRMKGGKGEMADRWDGVLQGEVLRGEGKQHISPFEWNSKGRLGCPEVDLITRPEQFVDRLLVLLPNMALVDI
jgi:hypothetical protein